MPKLDFYNLSEAVDEGTSRTLDPARVASGLWQAQGWRYTANEVLLLHRCYESGWITSLRYLAKRHNAALNYMRLCIWLSLTWSLITAVTIDGLDEYNSNPQDLIETLQALSSSCNFRRALLYPDTDLLHTDTKLMQWISWPTRIVNWIGRAAWIPHQIEPIPPSDATCLAPQKMATPEPIEYSIAKVV
jgi:hypothetical protein